MTINKDDNKVIMYDFTCPVCGTVFHANRSEPFCIQQHPGKWHLQGMHLGEEPCDSCMTWVEPLEQEIAEWKAGIRKDDEGIMFPPPGTYNAVWASIWKVTPVFGRKKERNR